MYNGPLRIYRSQEKRDEVRLKEVVARSPATCGNVTLIIGHGREDAELGIQVCVDSHDGRHIAASVAVVGGRPDGHDGFLWEMELWVNRYQQQSQTGDLEHKID